MQGNPTGSCQTASNGKGWWPWSGEAAGKTPSNKDVLSNLLPIANKWKTIGTLLELPPGKLDSIRNESHTEHDRLREMVAEWLKTPEANWEELVAAVKEIDPRKASEIERKFCS